MCAIIFCVLSDPRRQIAPTFQQMLSFELMEQEDDEEEGSSSPIHTPSQSTTSHTEVQSDAQSTSSGSLTTASLAESQQASSSSSFNASSHHHHQSSPAAASGSKSLQSSCRKLPSIPSPPPGHSSPRHLPGTSTSKNSRPHQQYYPGNFKLQKIRLEKCPQVSEQGVWQLMKDLPELRVK